MSLKKQYVKKDQACKVTFRVPRKAAMGAKSISVVGDFNNWSIRDNPMQKLKSGDFKTTINLEPDRQYQFRYLIDEQTWENDWEADHYVRSDFGNCDNSVVVV
ncbi:MAG: isoamylase early set domain-containing protein [Thermodesulfobacteriota bacterium]|nr:isoamylase early set domain-containing protein [Thermodesulfobacteriota bacterium]